MKPGIFRFQALLNVYQSKEDAIKDEIALIRAEITEMEQYIQSLFDQHLEAQGMLAGEGHVEEIRTMLHYIEGLMHKIYQARDDEEALQKKVLERMEALQEARVERKRYDKLREKHQKRVQYHLKGLEQKETDDFAQRKRNL